MNTETKPRINENTLRLARSRYVESEWTLREIATHLEINYTALYTAAQKEHWKAQRIEHLCNLAHGGALPAIYKPFKARIGQSCRFCHEPIMRRQSYGEDGQGVYHIVCMIPHAVNPTPRIGIGNLRPAPVETFRLVARLG